MKTREIKDVGYSIPVMTHSIDSPADTVIPHVVIANGFVGGTLAGALARRLVKVSRGAIDVSVYREPYVGSGGYAEAYRAGIFDKVVRSIGGQALVLAHSRGMIAWDEAGPDLLEDEIVQGFAALTPIGVSELPHASGANLAARLAAEISRPPLKTASGAVMTLKTTGHILQRCRRPADAKHEILRTLRKDTAETAITTSRAVPSVMILGSNDPLVPPAEVRHRLSPDTGYVGDIVEIPATHAGAFVDPRHTQAIYDAVRGITPN